MKKTEKFETLLTASKNVYLIKQHLKRYDKKQCWCTAYLKDGKRFPMLDNYYIINNLKKILK